MNIGGLKIKVTTGTPQSDNRTDWTTTQIRGSEKKKVIGLWIGGVFSLLFIAFVLWGMHFPFFIAKNIPNPFFCVLGIVSLVSFTRATWETLRLNRFGDPMLELNTAPIPLGGTVEGRVSISPKINQAPEFTVTLACIHSVTSNSGKNSSTRETVLWSAEKKTSLLLGGILPISMAVPEGQPQTNAANPFDCILWRLTVKAPFLGQAFLEKYEIPVGKAP